MQIDEPDSCDSHSIRMIPNRPRTVNERTNCIKMREQFDDGITVQMTLTSQSKSI